MAKKLIGREIPLSLVQRVILDLKKEAFYVNQFFPQILSARHGGLREDFIQNSGLDRFYVEELEREYCEVNKIDPAALDVFIETFPTHVTSLHVAVNLQCHSARSKEAVV